MRRLSVGTVALVLLVAAVFLGGLLRQHAIAKPIVLTVGFAVDGSGPVASSEQGQEIGRFLESRSSLPIKVRSFASEDQLYLWLTRFREVDIAWLSKDFLMEVPNGQLSTLATPLEQDVGFLSGEIVARQEMNMELQRKMMAVFLSLHESPSGTGMLANLGASRLVSPASRQGRDAPDTAGEVASTEHPGQQAPRYEMNETAVPVKTLGAPGMNAPELVAQVGVGGEAPPVVAGASGSPPSPGVSHATGREGEVALAADYLEYNSLEDSYEAKGDVVLRQAGIELQTEELLWQAATQDAAAQGSIVLRDADSEVFGERMQYNLATGQGQLHGGRVFVREGNFHLTGAQVEKHGQSSYFVRQGSFTTCDGEIPDWKFSASEVDVTLGGYARAKNVWFHIKDVPVLYTPYLRFPVKTERESGLLLPSFGYSNNKGSMASLAWYQVLERNMDATVYLDYLSEIGLGKGLEYRYALSGQNNGKALYYHVTGFSETPDLYFLEWENRGTLPGHWQLTADVEYANDKLFFEEFGEVAEDYNRDKTVSTLMLRRHWQKINLVGSARYIKNLGDDDFETLQRLPELGLSLTRFRLGNTPFYAGVESYATHFWRDQGEDGERLYLKPSLSAVFKPGSWLEVVPEVALYERIYRTDSTDEGKFVPEFSLTLATRLVKDFAVDAWGMERVQHSVEPKVSYTYVPDESQDDLPWFDLYDRIERQNNITYALVNRLVARSSAADGSRVYREVLNLRLSQSYDIDEERHDRSGEGRPFSDVRAELALRPLPNLSLDLDGRIPVYGGTHSHTLNVGVTAEDDKGNSVRAQYSYMDEDFAGIATDYAAAQLTTSVLKPVYVRFEERYDFQDMRELEKVLGLEYRSKCWSLLLTYRDRYREDGSDDQEIMATFVLAGLGQDQGFGGGF